MTVDSLLVYMSYGYFVGGDTRSCYEFCDVHGTLDAAKDACELYSRDVVGADKPIWEKFTGTEHYLSYVKKYDGREFCFQIDTKYLS